MTLYSKNGDYPGPLPSRIRLSNGMTRTDSTTFTDEEIKNAGYIKAENPPAVSYPNKVDWDGNTLQWVVREPTDQELAAQWVIIKNECQQLLAATDYKVITAYETGSPVDPIYVYYRQELRNIYNNVNNIDPWHVSWPTSPGDPNGA